MKTSIRRAPTMPRQDAARRDGAGSTLRRVSVDIAPLAISAGLALLLSTVRIAALQGALPVQLLVLVTLQALGLLVARESGGSARARGWWMVLACSCLLLPAMAIQTSMARTPFVSLGTGSAGALLLATLGVLALLGCMFVWTASVCSEDPSWAPLLWCPAALLAPAVLGSGTGDITEPAALHALALAFAVAAVAMVVGSLVSRHSRMAIAAIAVVSELAVLLLLRHGPSFAPQHGAIAPLLAMLLVFVAIGSVAAAQLAAVAERSIANATRKPPAPR
ncbi:MAG: hypothetical protein ACR2J8_14820 [Thermomicrobiales bacterium]